MAFGRKKPEEDNEFDISGIVVTPEPSKPAEPLEPEEKFAESAKPKEAKVKKQKPMGAFAGLTFADTFPLKQKLVLIQTLMIMARTGVPILDAISSIEKEAKNKVEKAILNNMRDIIISGRPINEAFENKYFTPVFSAFIKGGERTGRLKESLEILYEHIQREYELKSKVTSALIYPIILVAAMYFVVLLIFIGVMPQLQNVFLSSNIKAPLVTQIIFKISDFMKANLVLTISSPFIIMAIMFGLSRIKKVRKKFSDASIGFPVVGRIIKDIQITRFTRSLSAALHAGLSFPESLDLTEKVVIGAYKTAIHRFIDEIQRGVPLYTLLASEPKLFPSVVTQIVSIGETSGELPEVLKDLSEFYEKESSTAITNVIALVEPALILFMGLVVGLLSASVISTILQSVKFAR